MSDPRSPNTISGLVGWYTGLSAEVTSGSVSSWKDISGQGNHATTIRGSPQVSTSKVQGPTPGEHIVAFHYGNFDNHYGDGYQALWKTPGSTSWAVIPSSVFFHDDRDESTATEPTDPTVPFP